MHRSRNTTAYAVVQFAAIALALLALPAQARAVFVLRKGATTPILGFLVREDATAITIREPQRDGGYREHTIRRDEIEELIVTVSPERLAKLDPARPREYREYAEELAEKQRDPEARAAAIRLFHMAAWLDEGPLRKSSLLGMIALARSPDERHKFQAAAYLYDAEHDRSLLAAEAPLARAAPAREPLADLAQGLKALRQGMMGEARTIFERPTSRDALAPLSETVTHAELLAACSAKQLSSQQLRKVVAAELALIRALAIASAESPAETAARQATWSQAARTGGLRPLPTLDLATLTEFDPRACVFRGGVWVVP
jgi:hypothetical protein